MNALKRWIINSSVKIVQAVWITGVLQLTGNYIDVLKRVSLFGPPDTLNTHVLRTSQNRKKIIIKKLKNKNTRGCLLYFTVGILCFWFFYILFVFTAVYYCILLLKSVFCCTSMSAIVITCSVQRVHWGEWRYVWFNHVPTKKNWNKISKGKYGTSRWQ